MWVARFCTDPGLQPVVDLTTIDKKLRNKTRTVYFHDECEEHDAFRTVLLWLWRQWLMHNPTGMPLGWEGISMDARQSLAPFEEGELRPCPACAEEKCTAMSDLARSGLAKSQSAGMDDVPQCSSGAGGANPGAPETVAPSVGAGGPSPGARSHPRLTFISKECGRTLLGMQNEASKIIGPTTTTTYTTTTTTTATTTTTTTTATTTTPGQHHRANDYDNNTSTTTTTARATTSTT
jgi:hypothetical protein